MAGRIPQVFIDDLISRVDIVELISQRVKLKKTGSNYSGLCPFHSEKTPSFSVSPNKQFYHCFGCGASGSAISFLMQHDNLEFVEAIEELARIAGVEIPREAGTFQKERPNKDLYQIMFEVADTYYRNLKLDVAADAVAYLKNRGLNGETVKHFNIGFATDSWSAVKDSYSNSITEQLIDCGLVIKNETGRCYDRFRNRIMFPIRDRRGRTIAFGGRVMGDDTPKYLNSPETSIFHKGKELYGLYELLQSSNKNMPILVVEGYMDVVALAQFGINNAVATLGTAVTPDHIKTLFRVSDDIIFCFDGDSAGQKAAWKALEISLANYHAGKQARFLFLPEKHDPDSLIREHGKEELIRQMEQALPLSDYLYEHLSENLNLNVIDDCSRLIENATPYIKSVSDKGYRQALIEKLAEITRHKIGSSEKLSRIILGNENIQKASKLKIQAGQRSPMRTAISYLISQPSLHTLIDNAGKFTELDIAGIDLLIALTTFIKENPNCNTAMIIENWRDSEYAAPINKLAAKNNLLNCDETIESEFTGIIGYFEKQLREQKLAHYEKKLKENNITANELAEFNALLSNR